MVQAPLIIGTRDSALARWQAERVKALLDPVYTHVQIQDIQTAGDTDKTSPLHTIGGKGVFIKTLEAALLDKRIDIAVHSLKDITSQMPAALSLIAYLKAESAADAWVSDYYTTIPPTGSIATGSLRRQALVKRHAPDSTFQSIRGNIDTRVRTYAQSGAVGTLLSVAGLVRLNLSCSYTILPTDQFVPAPGQGVIVLQMRRNDKRHPHISLIQDHAQAHLSQIEQLFLHAVGLDCRAPLGVYAYIANKITYLRVFIAKLDPFDYIQRDTVISDDETVYNLADFILGWLAS